MDHERELAQKLWQACLDNELVIVSETLRKGADFNWKNPDKDLYTSLHVATHSEHEQIVEVLLDRGADPNTISEDEYSPLITACEMESKVLVKHLLEHDAKPDLEGTAESALHVAVACDNKEIAELLLTANATIDRKNKENETPLHTAAKHGHTDMVHFLINKKASIDEKNKVGYTALHYAAMHNHPEVVELLLNKGANPDTLSKNGFSPLISAAKSGSREIVQQLIQWSSPHGKKIDLSQVGPESNSALHFASDQAQLEVVKLLINEGSSDRLNQDGDTPLHLASRRGHVHVVQLLVKHGAKQNIPNKEGKTPIQLAKENNHQMTIAVLTRKPFSKQRSFRQEDPQPRAQSTDETLWQACYENKEDLIRKILLQGANQNWRNKEHNNFSCLDIAVYCNHTGVEKILLENVDQVKESALNLAASYGRAEAAESLISAGADVDAFDEDRNTPLHNAAAYGHLDTVKLLVQKQATLKRKNREQLTPLDVAKKRKRVDVMKFLEENESGGPASLASSSKSAADFEAALKAETEKRKQLEARLEQLETEKERVASVAQKRISDLNDELEKKREVISSQSYELEQKEKELAKPQVITVVPAASPEMNDLIYLKLKSGSSLSIIEFIASNPESQCIDFAHLLLKDRGKVQGLHDSTKEKDPFVRAVLKNWLDTADCNWGDLIDAMEKARMDERTVKTIRENFSVN